MGRYFVRKECGTSAYGQECIEAAQRLRKAIFIDEKRLLSDCAAMLDREIDALDGLATTIHFVVYDGSILAAPPPVGAIRLILPNEDVAQRTGWRLGLPMAERYDLRLFDTPGIRPAEVSRAAVLPEHRRTGAFIALYLAMRAESVHLNHTHWVAAANAETGCLECAWQSYTLAGHRGLLSRRFEVAPLIECRPPVPSLHRVVDGRTLECAGERKCLELPYTLRSFVRLGARIMGPPIQEPHYEVCSLPIEVMLAGSPTLRHFALPMEGRASPEPWRRDP